MISLNPHYSYSIEKLMGKVTFLEDSWLQAPLAPLAKGLLSIFSFVTYQTKRKIEKKWLLHPILHPDLLLFCWFNSCLFESSMNRSLLFSASCLWLVKSNKSSSKLHFLRFYFFYFKDTKTENYLFVLVGRDCDEFSLFEDISAESRVG